MSEDNRNRYGLTRTSGNFRIKLPSRPMPFTGERMTSAVEGQIAFEHYHRYCIARDLVLGLDVLDVASGEGYGSTILATTAQSVVGVELDGEAVAHARSAYDRENLRFLQGNALALPLDDASVDVVVSFETLEHVDDQGRFLDEVRRVLRPNGLLIVSTPDRSVYSAYGTDPNPYHVLELTAPEFRSLLESHFGNVELAKQRPVLGSLLASDQEGQWRSYERRDAETIEASAGLARAHYLLAVASDGNLPSMPSSVYIDRRRVHDVVQQALQHDVLSAQATELTRERDEVRADAIRLQEDVGIHRRQAEDLLHERDEARAELQAAQRQVEILVRERDEVRAEAATAQRQVEILLQERDQAQTAQRRIETLVRERDEAQAETVRLSRDVQSATRQVETLARERDELRAGTERLHEDVAIHCRQEDALLHERDAARADAARLEQDLAVHRRQEDALVHERDTARADAARLSDEVQSARRQVETLTQARDATWLKQVRQGGLTALAAPRPSSHQGLSGAARTEGTARKRLIRKLVQSPLFDTDWYRARSGLAETSRENLVVHYVETGDGQDLSPHPLFSPSFYRMQAPDAASAGVNALDHYIETAPNSGSKPHPLFDPDVYRAANAGVPGSVEPLQHYLREGWRRGFQTHPLFDSSFYLAANPDVGASGVDALRHYLIDGWREGRQPHPLFDPAYYLRQNPDIAEGQIEPLAHYLAHGSAEGRQPHPLFDSAHYRSRYADIAQSNVEPLSHYATIGWREGRQPHPLFDPAHYLERYPDVTGTNADPLTDFLSDPAKFDRVTHPLFDPAYYRAENPDIAEGGLNPLAHFLDAGWREGRMPHPLFDPAYYLSHSPDVRAINPLVHYAGQGWREGRKPHPVFDPIYYRERHRDDLPLDAEPLDDFLRQGDRLGRNPHPLFDVAHYRLSAGLAAEDPQNSLLHYLRIGACQGIAPHPLFHATGYAMDQRDLSRFGGNALLHYLGEGAAASARPHPLFDPDFYTRTHGDVAGSAMTAFEHYVRFGIPERRRCSELLKDGETLLETRLELPEPAEDSVTVIIPVYRSYGDTYRCLHSIAAAAENRETARVVIADDCPADPIAPFFGAVPNLEIIAHPENLGFLRSCNRAAALTGGTFVVFLNNDTVVRPGWLFHLVAPARRDPLVAMVGCKLLNADGTVQEAGGVMFKDGWGYPYGRNDDAARPEYNFVRQVDCVIGACFLVRRRHFEEVGGLDDRYYPAFFEEFDLAMAFADRGYRVLYQPASEVFHIGSSSYGAEMRDRQSVINHDRFAQKWKNRLAKQFDGVEDLFLARDRRFPRGTILVVDDMVPEYDKHAGALTLFQYLQLFVRLGFKVVYLPHDLHLRQPYTKGLQQSGIEVLYGDVDVRAWLRTNGPHLDYVWIARPDVAKARLDDILTLTMARVLYYTHDLHFLREQRRYELDGDPYSKQESERLLPIETDIFNRVDCVLTPSAEEVPIIRQLSPSVTAQVLTPYFFDAAAPAPSGSQPIEQRRNIIFVGGYGHVPNVDAAILLARKIMPLVWRSVPDAKLLLVGSNPPPEVRNLAGPRVDVSGFVPDLAPWYARARMSVSPLRWGAGVKGKIVESLMAGVPVVTTPIGNEGIALEHGRQVLIGTTEREIAEHVIALFRDESLLKSLAKAGPEVIATRFSEDVARAALLKALSLRICSTCGARFAADEVVELDPEAPRNWREEPACPACWALNRMNAVADVVVRPYRTHACASVVDALPYMRDLRVHEFGFAGPMNERMRALPGFSCSDFFPDLPSYEARPDGVLNEDLSGLSFEDEAFDLSISMEVLEHVPNPRAAFREIFRTLVPGGRHIMSVPYSPHVERSTTRCEILNGELVHHLPADYHGDPIRSEGALVFTDYGRDLIDMLQQVGFVVSVEETRHDGVQGGYVAVFNCLRPRSPTAQPDTSSTR